MTKHKYIKYISFAVFFAGLVALIFWEFAILEPGLMKFPKEFLLGKSSTFAESQQGCSAQADGYQKWSCSRAYFEKVTNNFSAATAMEEAMKLREDEVVRDCHLFAHIIGEATLEKNNFNVSEAFFSCSFGCANGCFHGVMERFIRNEADPYNAVSKIQNMCDSVESDNWMLKRNCVHGVGHGLLAHGYLTLREAMDACEVFGPGWGDFCVGGLIMEHMDQYLLLNLDKEKFIEIIPEICSEFEIEELGDCLESLALGLLYYTGYDVQHSEELCQALESPWLANICKQYVASGVIGERISTQTGF